MGGLHVPNKILFLIFTMVFSYTSLATTFQTMPLSQLVEEASSAAEVELKSKKTYKNNFGMIMTDFTFLVIENFYLSEREMDGELVTITMSGGTLDGITSYIDSAPEFFIGERSFLLLKKIESKIYLSNFTMGKYKIEEIDGQTFYISTVFPNDSDLGKVKKERMIDLMNLKFKMIKSSGPESLKLKKITMNKIEASKFPKFEERKPAQENSDKNQEFCVAMWGFLALFSASGIIIWWKLRKGVSA